MTRWWIALGSVSAFTALAAAVHVGLLDEFDSVVREWARPHDVWGAAQVRADLVVHGLRPAVLVALLAVFTVACGMKRRSLRLVWFVASVCLATVALTAATKAAVGRPDTHGSITNGFGGSFPSGHVTTVVVCLGLAVLVARPHAQAGGSGLSRLWAPVSWQRRCCSRRRTGSQTSSAVACSLAPC